MRAWMSAKFGQIRPRTTGLAALEPLKTRYCHVFSVAIDPIHNKFVGNEDMRTFHLISQTSSNFGQIGPPTTALSALVGLKIPQYNVRNDVSTFSQLFMVQSFCYLQVMRTCIKTWMSLNYGQIWQMTSELAALEHLNNRRRHFFSVAIDPILVKLACN